MLSESFHQRTVEEHLDELAFLLHLRESLIPFSLGDVREWLGLDRRIAAHIQGLLLREGMAWDRLRVVLAVRPTRDRLRVAGVLALNASQPDPIRDYLSWLDDAPSKQPFADEVARWVLPSFRPRAAAFLSETARPSETARALWIELFNLGSAGTGLQAWESMAEQLLSCAKAAPHTARALSRLSTRAGLPALQMLLQHPDSGIRAGTLCSLMAFESQEAPRLVWQLEPAAISSFSTPLFLRAILRSPDADVELRLSQLWRMGFKEASVLGIGACGRSTLLSPLLEMIADPEVAKPAGRLFEVLSGHFSGVQPTVEAGKPDVPTINQSYVHLGSPDRKTAADWLRGPGQTLPQSVPLIGGQARTDGLCLEALRHGDCTCRLLFAEVLLVSHPGLLDLDIRAPMYQQLRHPAMSTSKSI